MKKYFVILFIVLIQISCQKNDSNKNKDDLKHNEFNVKIDTFNAGIHGDLTEAVLFKNDFYCMFETSRKNTSEQFIKMVVLNQKGKFVEDVFVPKKIQKMPHYDLIVDQDDLYVKESQFEKENFVLGKYVADLEQVKTRDFCIFKDEIYNVYSDTKGEWGGTIFFENNETKEVFEAYSNFPVAINKIKNEYYISNKGMFSSNVLKISDPSKLHKSILDFSKNESSEFDQGVDIVFEADGIAIETSFVVQDQLFHLYSYKDNVFIGVVEKGKMQQKYKFNFNFYSYSRQNFEDKKKLLTFYIPSNRKSGILIIDKKDFYFHILK
ncbi:hypothetical protein HNP37_001589 [Flavobacterium nitrogenifigens]|uniref:Uncharacterized protein n=2 Tax=Flavobacterium TaxID=237 RepID=A0A7W7N6C1_9FLAO|nr:MULTISPECIES: hypothetical protein [Flavobacterium]MBB4801528.1 hypothetical protein [Flavobacterium nitrogenifigens]MBB6386485.1 hypothetical protein [Flavobacterium notoginsengisoli]